jgi:hypothetical protein
VTDRVQPGGDQARKAGEQDAHRTAARPTRFAFELASPGWLLAAALSAGAGIVHLGLMPSAMDEWAVEGMAFAAVAWVQLVGGVLLTRRRPASLAQALVAADVVFLVAWTVSRTRGSPWGPHRDHPAAATAYDLLCVAMEVAFVLLAVHLSSRPPSSVPARAPRSRRGRLGLVGSAAGATLVLAVAGVAVASPGARTRAEDSHAGHGDHAAAHGDHMVDDKGLSTLLYDPRGPASEVALDPATQAALDRQLAPTRLLVERYPTVQAAEAAGYDRFGPFSPGIGAHYALTGPVLEGAGGSTGDDGLVTAEGVLKPLLVFAGTSSDSPLAGFLFLSIRGPGLGEPAGFVGSSDVWYRHEDLCLVERPDGVVEVPFGLRASATQAGCDEFGGQLSPWSYDMAHVWNVPGWESSLGLFGEVNPRLTCPDGTYYQLAVIEFDTRLSTCFNQ